MAAKLSKDDAIALAVRDASARLGIPAEHVRVEAAVDLTFPNSALGAGRSGEMALAVMTPGWQIRIATSSGSLEYRASRSQVRLAGFEGRNHLIHPA